MKLLLIAYLFLNICIFCSECATIEQAILIRDFWPRDNGYTRCQTSIVGYTCGQGMGISI